MAATYEELIAKSRELNAAGDIEGAKRVARIAISRRDGAQGFPPEPAGGSATNPGAVADLISNIHQAGSGTSEGVANFLGSPVDIATMGMNAAWRGIDAAAGTKTPQIENPFGGSGTFRQALSPFISDEAPKNATQRYLRRGGQALGFGIPAAMTGAAFSPAAMSNMPAYMGSSMAGDVTSAVAGQTSREIAPNNDTADFIASLVGGVGGSALASRMTPALQSVPSLDDLKGKARDKWNSVQNGNTELTPYAAADLENRLRGRITSERATNPLLFPRTNATMDDISGNPNNSLYGVEENRRLIGRNVAKDANEASVGVAMKREIDNYLNGLTAKDVTGASPEQTVADLFTARKTTHQVKKAETVLNKEMRGETRAATTGSGGNEVNATRQNIRALFDKERDPTLSGKKQGYTSDEMAAMETVVKGTKGSNVARALGRFSPQSGALGLMGGMGGMAGIGAGISSGNALPMLMAVPSFIGSIAKPMAEGLTKSHIEKLMLTIRNGGKAPAESAARQAANKAVIMQMISQPSRQSAQ